MKRLLRAGLIGLIVAIATYVFGSRLVLPFLSNPSFGLSPDTAFGVAIIITGALMGLAGFMIRRAI